MKCEVCKHTEPHSGGGIGVCLYDGCGCDGAEFPLYKGTSEIFKPSLPSILGLGSNSYSCELCGSLVSSEKLNLHLDWHQKLTEG